MNKLLLLAVPVAAALALAGCSSPPSAVNALPKHQPKPVPVTLAPTISPTPVPHGGQWSDLQPGGYRIEGIGWQDANTGVLAAEIMINFDAKVKSADAQIELCRVTPKQRTFCRLTVAVQHFNVKRLLNHRGPTGHKYPGITRANEAYQHPKHGKWYIVWVTLKYVLEGHTAVHWVNAISPPIVAK